MVILRIDVPWLGFPDMNEELRRVYVEADNRPARAIWFGIEGEDVLRTVHELGCVLGLNPPLILSAKLQFLFKSFDHCLLVDRVEQDLLEFDELVAKASVRPPGAALSGLLQAKTIKRARPRHPSCS